MNFIHKYNLANQFDIKPMHPFGIKITLKDDLLLQGDLLVELIRNYKMVLFRNTPLISKDLLIQFAKTMGPLLEWEFGNVMEMREDNNSKNYLFTNGPVPFHWDGAFHTVPRYLIFHCIEAPLPECGGETIFSNTHLIWKNAPIKNQTEWRNIKITYKTEKLAHYGGCITVPLVQDHPDTGETILRFAEPVPESMLNPVDVLLENHDEIDTKKLILDMTKRCYKKSNSYIHSWLTNDLLIADNHTLLHARHAFTKSSPRHLRRIQVL